MAGRRRQPVDRSLEGPWHPGRASEFLWLVAYVGANLIRSAPEHIRADLHAEGCLGLCDAAGRFDPARGRPFSTYAPARIRGAILDAMRAEQPGYNRAARAGVACVPASALTAPAAAARLDGDEPTVEEIAGVTVLGIPPYDRPEARLEQADAIDDIARGCSRVERALLRLYYLHGFRMKQVGAFLGLSESRISQLHSALCGRIAEARPDLRDRGRSARRAS